MTIKALSFLDNPDKISCVADLGCGTGGQTMVLAQNITGNKAVEAYIENEKCEVELYLKYKQHCGYVFYAGKKI